MPKNELTICTVSFQSEDFVRANRGLLSRLNPGSAPRWVIADNKPEKEAGAAGFGELGPRDEVIAGERISEFHGPAKASLHHGSALMKAMRKATTRFVLLLDPDFFIVRPGWVSETVSYMEQRGLALLAAPWNPKWHAKPRYFPACTHCAFLDASRIDLGSLDLSPAAIPGPERTKRGGRVRRWARGILSPVWDSLYWHTFNRKTIGSERDTGFRLREAVLSSPSPQAWEAFVPVFRPRGGRGVERLFPERWSYLPTRPESYSTRGFASFGFPDMAKLGCEEFLWKEEPFGFHFRGHPKKDRPDVGAERRAVLQAVEGFPRQEGPR